MTRADEEERLAHELARNLLLDAVLEQGSDIHINTKRSDSVVRYRIDGRLQEISRHPHRTVSALNRAVKLHGPTGPGSYRHATGRHPAPWMRKAATTNYGSAPCRLLWRGPHTSRSRPCGWRIRTPTWAQQDRGSWPAPGTDRTHADRTVWAGPRDWTNGQRQDDNDPVRPRLDGRPLPGWGPSHDPGRPGRTACRRCASDCGQYRGRIQLCQSPEGCPPARPGCTLLRQDPGCRHGSATRPDCPSRASGQYAQLHARTWQRP